MSDRKTLSSTDPTTDHSRRWRDFRYVYPVISRRSKGLSIGVNLNPDQRCTFRCLYCQVRRSERRRHFEMDLDVLARELRQTLEEAVSGRIWSEPRLAGTPEPMRRLNDIAFSGDGEPTCAPDLDRAIRVAADLRREMGLDELKLILITNTTHVSSAEFRRAKTLLDENNGEIWAKLDAGSEEYFRRVNRPHPSVTLEGIVSGILSLAVARPIVIQTLLCRLDGRPPSTEEIEAYCLRLRWLIANGGQIRLVQLHTVARPPASASVSAVSEEELQAIADHVRADLPGLAVETY